jgi:YVTN family beta-propeller protein
MSARLILPSMLTALALFAGCSGSSQDPLFPNGGQSVISSSRGDVLYVANPDHGTVSVVDPAGDVTQVTVGSEPSRIARANGKVYVTLRGERSVAVMTETASGLELDHKFQVGTEPFGIAATESGKRIYVAVSTQNEVLEIDTSNDQVLRSFSIGGQPKWISLHPSGKTLYVASAFGGQMSWVDLGSGQVHDFELPSLTSVDFADDDGSAAPLTLRLTGDVGVSPSGRVVAIPSVYVDSEEPVGEPTDDGVVEGGYGSSNGDIGLSRVNPVVTAVLVGPDGVPAVDTAQPVNVASRADIDSASSIVRSYPSSVTFAPDSETMYITMEGSRVVIAASTSPVVFRGQDENGFGPRNDVQVDSESGFGSGLEQVATSATSVITVPEGPNGVAFLADGNAYVNAFLDRSVSVIDAESAHRDVSQQVVGDFVSSTTARASGTLQVAEPVLPADVEMGRRLFYSSVTSSMAGSGSGISCATCHMDGRNDGVTWTFDEPGLPVKRQTPSLAGKVSETLPLTWASEVDSVGDEVRITSQGRMGGIGLSPSEELAVSAYVDFTREVDHPLKGLANDQIARGKALFESAEVGCATCHTGARLTDGLGHDLYGGKGINTPSHTGVATTAPYLHDGSAATLSDVLASAARGEMGDTSMLTPAENADLLAYLKSL